MGMCVLLYVATEPRSVRSSGARFRGGHKMPNMDTENQTQVQCKIVCPLKC